MKALALAKLMGGAKGAAPKPEKRFSPRWLFLGCLILGLIIAIMSRNALQEDDFSFLDQLGKSEELPYFTIDRGGGDVEHNVQRRWFFEWKSRDQAFSLIRDNIQSVPRFRYSRIKETSFGLIITGDGNAVFEMTYLAGGINGVSIEFSRDYTWLEREWRSLQTGLINASGRAQTE